jgi:hypothetical protein
MTSTDRILTTHTGSLPRPPGLVEALGLAGDEAADRETQDRLLRDAVAGVVARQVEAGIDTVSDGEQSKAGYSTYVTERLTGFGGSAHPLRAQQDTIDFPDWGEPLRAGIEAMLATPACIGEVAYADTALMERDVENLRRALGEHPGSEGFMTTASPGVISMFLENQHYPSHEDYLAALAATMRCTPRATSCRSTAPTSRSGATSSSRICRSRSSSARSSCTSRRSTTRRARSRRRRCASTCAGATTRDPTTTTSRSPRSSRPS